ncbi:hypothetical protein FS749_014554 [Ceratobasidium sp. UAMH 11750]|nr:hypothetical protein FS749_014554 [Ceratobasidium sp. UAMH 11750]
MDGPIVGVKDCMRSNCKKSRKHSPECRSKACRNEYGPNINPQRPETGYCSEKCTHRAEQSCIIA